MVSLGFVLFFFSIVKLRANHRGGQVNNGTDNFIACNVNEGYNLDVVDFLTFSFSNVGHKPVFGSHEACSPFTHRQADQTA